MMSSFINEFTVRLNIVNFIRLFLFRLLYNTLQFNLRNQVLLARCAIVLF